jgi:hypothetical protein
LFFLPLIIFFAACSDRKESIKDFDKIQPHSNDTIKKLKKESADTNNYWRALYTGDTLKLSLDSIHPSFSKHFVDRFNAKSFFKNVIYKNGDSINHNRWTFKDSTQTKNAFYNWLDCFGTRCTSVKLFEPFKSGSISYISSNQVLDKETWTKYEKLYHPKDSLKTLLILSKNKKAVWYQYTKNEFKIIKK